MERYSKFIYLLATLLTVAGGLIAALHFERQVFAIESAATCDYLDSQSTLAEIGLDDVNLNIFTKRRMTEICDAYSTGLFPPSWPTNEAFESIRADLYLPDVAVSPYQPDRGFFTAVEMSPSYIRFLRAELEASNWTWAHQASGLEVIRQHHEASKRLAALKVLPLVAPGIVLALLWLLFSRLQAHHSRQKG